MNKEEARRNLDEVKSEIADCEREENNLKGVLTALTTRLTELRTVVRYLSRITGEEKPQQRKIQGNIRQITIADAAAQLVVVGEQLATREIADRLLQADYPYPPGRGQLVGTLGTVLARHPKFRRLRRGHWERLTDDQRPNLFDYRSD
jgi:hypothetical protein